MSDIMIQAEDIGKKYMLTHQQHGKYTALRDVIAEKAKALTQRFLVPSKTRQTSYSKEEFWALKDISFDIRQGVCIGIIGPNGAGKSTLLKILSRITEPTTGRVKINGLVGSLLEVGTGFHPELTGRENIFLNGAILGMSKKDIKNKFDEIVGFAEIEKFLDTPVKRYSSGMYVRLAFAVAAHLEPEILLIDEVLAVGDLAFQKKCLGKMGDITKIGRTVLFVSHNMIAIRNLCERIIWIDNGQIVKMGPSHEIIKAYEETVVRDSLKCSAIATRSQKDTQNLSFFFKHVEMLNTDDKHSTKFRYDDTMILIVELFGEAVSNHYSIEFRLFGELGVIYKSFNMLCVGASGPYHNLYFDKKIKKVRINIGPLMLSSGNYSISLSVMTGAIRADTWNNVFSFEVIECQPFATGHENHAAGCVILHTFSVITSE